MKEQLLKVGTKVFDIRFGWGEITKNDVEIAYPYNVKFREDAEYYYGINGTSDIHSINPLLSLTEYTLENGGFTPLSDYNKPKVGDIGYFWDDEDSRGVNEQKRIIYSIITDIDDRYIDGGDFKWDNFSKELPEWLTQKLGNNN
jgi:hypothetical protein